MDAVIAFLVVVALAAATFLLGRSLFTHLRRVPATFDSAGDRDRSDAPDAATGTAATAPRIPAPAPRRATGR